jgi:hypothetical protein
MITTDIHIKDVTYEKYKPVFGQFIPTDVFVHLTLVFSDMKATTLHTELLWVPAFILKVPAVASLKLKWKEDGTHYSAKSCPMLECAALISHFSTALCHLA